MYHDNSIKTGNGARVLVDKTKTGKERPWRMKKISNVKYYELLHILEFKKASRVAECGQVLEFAVDEDGNKRLARAWFCKSRMCAMCNWRRTMKHSYQSMKVVEEVMRRKPNARWLFLTLTTRNSVDGGNLDKNLRSMTAGFNRLMKYKKVSKNLIGFMRATEVTVNQEDGTYNQHMHVLLCVENTYFKNSENYISQKEWTSLWKRAMQLSYTPVVHIQAIKPKNKHKSDIRSAIDETAKYPVKDSDYLTNDQERNLEIVKDLEEGLYRKRLVSYGGLLKQVHKELNLDNAEDGDLIKVNDDDEVGEKVYSIIAYWHWKKQNYYIKN